MGNKCTQCDKGEMVIHEVKAKVSVAGLFGAFIAVIGIILLFFQGVWGVLTIILGFLIGYFGRGKHMEAICPMCGYKNKM